MKVGEIYKTNDYDFFKKAHGNRELNEAHIVRIMDSMKTQDLNSPILINGNQEVIDGQHRLEARKRLGLPVTYYIEKSYGLNEIQRLNANTRDWNKKEHLQSFVNRGYPEYIKFRKFWDTFPRLNFAAVEILLSDDSENSSRSKKTFENGKLKVSNYRGATQMAQKIMDIAPYFSGFSRRPFIRAMKSIFKIDKYSHEQFIKRLEANPGSIYPCANATQYTELIEEVYNYRSRIKISLKYGG